MDAYKDQSAANCLRLLLLTGSRAGEALEAEWTEFDLQRGVRTKPTHQTKQKKEEHLPLIPPAIDLLRSTKPRNASGPLFPGKSGGARVTLRRPWVQACKVAGLVEENQIEGKLRMLTRHKPTVRIHDLRHIYASHLFSGGAGLQIVGKPPRHVQESTTMR